MDRRSLLKMMAGVPVMLSSAGALAQSAAKGASQSTLRFVTPELAMLTGAFNSSGPIYQISAKMFDGLVDYDFDMKPVPQLALTWNFSEDGTVLKFGLRPGVLWHDGKPFTSQDVAWSAMNVWKVAHPRGRSTYAHLVGVETPDDLTAIFKFSRPAPAVMKALHAVESQILPKHLYEGKDLHTHPNNVAPVGTGPFRFVRWERGSHVMLERNQNYWDKGKPLIDRFIIRTISDTAARSAGFEAQEIDIGGGMPVPLNDARRLEALPFLEIPKRGDEAIGAQSWIEFNLRRPIFKDVRVRRAIAHALDRKLMMNAIWFNFGTVSTGPINPAMKPFYTDKVATYEYSLEKANRLLDEAGHPRGANGIRFEITHDALPFSEYYFKTGDYFKQALSRVGIAVTLRSQDFASWSRRVYTDNDFDTINASAHNLTDPSIGVQRFFWSKNIIKGVPFSNGSGYSNPEVDRLLEEAQVEVDESKRAEKYHRFQQIVVDELPQIPVGNISWFTIQNKKVTGADQTPFGAHGNLANTRNG